MNKDNHSGATCDALLLRVAEIAKVDLIVMLNEKDFRRLNPDLADKVVAPHLACQISFLCWGNSRFF
jgi:hypothetical protein